MTPYRNVARKVAAFLLLFLLGNTGEAQEDTKAEIAKLRAEVAKLRADIKKLTEKVNAQQAGPRYRGKPASYWFEQLDDADYKFRAEAIHAIGSLAKKNRALIRERNMIPLMIGFLREDYGSNPEVSGYASLFLGLVGPEALPALIEVARDKTLKNRNARKLAIDAIGLMGAKAKLAVPLFVAIMKEEPGSSMSDRAITILGNIGPDAKPAMPALIGLIEGEFRNETIEPMLGFSLAHEVRMTLNAMLRIDPQVGKLVPTNDGGGAAAPFSPPMPGGSPYLSFRQAEKQWRLAIDALKKKYPAPK